MGLFLTADIKLKAAFRIWPFIELPALQYYLLFYVGVKLGLSS